MNLHYTGNKYAKGSKNRGKGQPLQYVVLGKLVNYAQKNQLFSMGDGEGWAWLFFFLTKKIIVSS